MQQINLTQNSFENHKKILDNHANNPEGNPNPKPELEALKGQCPNLHL